MLTKAKKIFKKAIPIFAFLTPLALSACKVTYDNGKSFLSAKDYTSKELLRISLGVTEPFSEPNFSNFNFNIESTQNNPMNQAALKLFSYKTTGEWKFDNNNQPIEKPQTELFLEGATGFKLYGEKAAADNSKTLEVIYQFESNDTNQGIIKGEDLSKIREFLPKTIKAEFIINDKLNWYDAETKAKKDPLSAYDFVAGLKMFYNSSKLKLARNSYLLGILGIDAKKTFEDKSNETGNVLTLHMDPESVNPFVFDQLNLNYYAFAPSKNPEVQALLNLDLKNSTEPIYVKNGRVDLTQTNFEKIYGWGERQKYGAKGWYAGSYLLDSTSLQDIVTTANKNYFDAIKYSGKYEDKIKKIIWSYGNAFKTVESQYGGFLTNEIDYVNLNNNTATNALQKFGEKSNYIRLQGAGQVYDGGDVWWNTEIWTEQEASGGGVKIVKKPEIDDSYVSFVEKFWTEDAIKVRSALTELVNYPKLFSNLYWIPGNYDFKFSSIPYGNFNVDVDGKQMELYESYYKGKKFKIKNPYDNDKLEEFEPYSGVLNNPWKAYLDDIKSTASEGTYLLKSLPDFTKRKAEVIQALKSLGYSKTKPLTLKTVMRENPLTQKTNNLWINLTSSLSELTDGLFVLKPLFSYTASVREVFSNNGYPIAYNRWSMDFRDVSNWITRSFGYFEHKQGDSYDAKIVNPNTKQDPVQRGLVNQLSIAQLWPKLLDDLLKHKDDTNLSWQKSLLDHLKTKNVFKDPANPKYNEANPDKVSGEISAWASTKDYNNFVIAKYVDETKTLFPWAQGGYFARAWSIARPWFKTPAPTYGELYIRDWSLNKKG